MELLVSDTGTDSVCGLMCVCVARYDIKGCEVSRWTEPAPEGSHIIVVLKDLNFEGQYISLGKQTGLLYFYFQC